MEDRFSRDANHFIFLQMLVIARLMQTVLKMVKRSTVKEVNKNL